MLKPTKSYDRFLAKRRTVFVYLVAEHGGTRAIARKLGYSNGSTVSMWATGKRNISERTARAIEAKLKLPSGYLDDEAKR